MSRVRMTKREKAGYANYVKRYKQAKKMLERRGYSMADTMLTKREYLMVRRSYIEDGMKININQTIVAEQKYEYSLKVAQQFKRIAEQQNLSWKDKTITELRKGAVDVSEYNNILKEIHPDWTGYDRAKNISQEMFGSE